MTGKERDSIKRIMGNISTSSDGLINQQTVFKGEFPFALSEMDYGIKLLEDALLEKNEEDIDYAFYIAPFFRSFNENDIPLLIEVLECNCHTSHEDIIREFEKMKSSQTIEILFKTATRQFDYFIRDEEYPLARPCIWALWKIGTEDAISRIKLLSEFGDEQVKAYAISQLTNKRC